MLKLLKWPFSSLPESPPAPKEVMVKFTNLTRYLFLIELPEDLIASNVTDEGVWQGKQLFGKSFIEFSKKFAFHYCNTIFCSMLPF